uniref:MyTH4 domain-containing protein n=1 Tax=Balaenoptera musculus TaxID=9771 RepID=A0A8C0DI85_BALMU
MQFMGDQSKPRGKNDLDLLYGLLKLCQEKENLRDEIYCQAIKQITGHPRPGPCARGWTFLSLLTGYFSPSTSLMPYVTKFLQHSALSQELARRCQEHLQRTVKYGGRRRLPSPGEMQAFLKGQVAHLLLIRLPGGVEYKANIHTFTVSTGTRGRGWGDPGKPWASVLGTPLPSRSLLPSPAPPSRPCPHVQVAAEVLEEMCGQMGITDPHEVQEFALFLIKGEGAVGLPAGEAVGQRPGRCPTRQAGCLAAPQQEPRGAPLRARPTGLLAEAAAMADERGRCEEADGPGAEAVARMHLSGSADQLHRGRERAAPLRLHCLHGAESEQAGPAQPQPPGAEPPAPHPHGPQLSGGPGSWPKCWPGHPRATRLPPPTLTPPPEGPSSALSPPVPPPRPQELHCSIALRDLQRLHMLSPLGAEGSPGLELNYGSADDPQTIWFELPQVGGLCAP